MDDDPDSPDVDVLVDDFSVIPVHPIEPTERYRSLIQSLLNRCVLGNIGATNVTPLPQHSVLGHRPLS